MVAHGGCTYGDCKIKCIQVLPFWCNNANLCENSLDIVNEFDEYILKLGGPVGQSDIGGGVGLQ